MIGPILLIGAGALALYLNKGLKTKNAGDKLVLDFRDITGAKIKGWKILFNVRFDATNPTETTLNLEQAILDLTLDGIGTIAKIRNTSTISFTANERKTITIPTETDNLLLMGLKGLQLVFKVLSGTANTITKGTLKGTLKANGFNSDYNQEINFK